MYLRYVCCNTVGNFMDLVRYLQMARKKSSDDIIGRELAYALEKIS